MNFSCNWQAMIWKTFFVLFTHWFEFAACFRVYCNRKIYLYLICSLNCPTNSKNKYVIAKCENKKICHFQLFDPLHTLSHLLDAQRWEKKHNENRKKARSRIFLFRNVFFADSVFVAKGWKQSWKKEWTNIHLHWHSKKCTNQMISWQSFDSFSQFIIWIFFKQYAHCSKNERIN